MNALRKFLPEEICLPLPEWKSVQFSHLKLAVGWQHRSILQCVSFVGTNDCSPLLSLFSMPEVSSSLTHMVGIPLGIRALRPIHSRAWEMAVSIGYLGRPYFAIVFSRLRRTNAWLWFGGCPQVTLEVTRQCEDLS